MVNYIFGSTNALEALLFLKTEFTKIECQQSVMCQIIIYF